ncbi:histidine kinase [Cohnella sp. GCM10027633]|uniref:GAF domain-containing sensor histidine kinase n=1 Tax=unclassified Cohnella TaxID=2636738 RepID=UPI0036324F35
MDTIRTYRLLIGLFFAVTAALYVSSIPGYYDALRTQCIPNGCGLSVPALNFDSSELSVHSATLLFIIVDCSFTAVFYAAAGIMLWKGSREPIGLLAALAMVAFGTSFPSLVMVGTESASFARGWFHVVSAIGWIAISLFCLLFPNGKFVPAWSRYAMAAIALVDVANVFYGGNIWARFDQPEYVQFAWYMSTTALLIYAQSYRFRRVSSPEQRQQTKWVVYGVTVSFVGFAAISLLFDPNFYDGRATSFIYLNVALHLCLSAIPVTLTFAVLRSRLWAINPLVKRTLLYGALTVTVALLYAAVVLYLGTLFDSLNHFVVSLIATGLVAALFAPLKEWLQRQVNRLLKGRHDDPYAVLLELGNQLVRPMAPEAMLEAIARQVKEALRLPYAGISIGIQGQEAIIAEAGTRSEAMELHEYPIIYGGRTLGTLYAASRSAGEAFSSEDNVFLDVMLRHAGPLLNNADMLGGMRRLAEDLQESRERLVLAREEERRRIRNNLHDDLAPRLAALALNAAIARKYVEKDKAAATAMLDELGKVIRTTVQDMRSLVNDLRPPALDQLGLIGAIEARMEELSKPASLVPGEAASRRLLFNLDCPPTLPELRAAVEVAAYRILTESMVNVVKHAEASACKVKLYIDDVNRLRIEVSDDGIGAAIGQAGVGLTGGIGMHSMRERAAEIGGECGIERPAAGGTRVWAILPL